MQDVTILNLAYLKSISKGSKDFELKMLSTFITQTTEELKILSKNMEEKNLDAIYTSIHKIKPSFHFIGASDTEKLVFQIEDVLLKKKKDENLKELLDAFIRSANLDMEAVHALIANYQKK